MSKFNLCSVYFVVLQNTKVDIVNDMSGLGLSHSKFILMVWDYALIDFM